MTITVECPYCETEYELNPDLRGKTMRCPNSSCRELFEVQEKGAPVAQHSDPLPEQQLTIPQESPSVETARGRVDDFVPVLEVDIAPPDLPYEKVESQLEMAPPVAESYGTLTVEPEKPTVVEDERPPEPKPERKVARLITETPQPTVATAAPLRTARVVEPKPVAKRASEPPRAIPKPTSTVNDAPQAIPRPSSAVSAPVDDPEAPAQFVRRRRKNRSWVKALVVVVPVALMITAGVIYYGFSEYFTTKESILRREAKEAFDKSDYPVAQKKYEELLASTEESPERPTDQFLAGLCELQLAVNAVTLRENPNPARKVFEKFLETHASSQHLKTGDASYLADVLQAGHKLADAYADLASDKLKSFRVGRNKPEELTLLETAVEAGRKWIPAIEKFRDKDSANFDLVRNRYTELTNEATAERKRLAILAPYRNLPDQPSDEGIEAFENALREGHLLEDTEAKAILAEAEAALRSRIGYVAREGGAPFRTLPVPKPLIFTSLTRGAKPRLAAEEPLNDTCLAVARGVLYALDSRTGDLLWGFRFTPANAARHASDLPPRVPFGDDELVLVAGVWNGRPGIAAKRVRSGDLLWHQFLALADGEYNASARPVVVGNRVYVPLSDKRGTCLEIDLASGRRTGELDIMQPIGGGIAVLPGTKPGVNYLFIPGDAKRMFVFEVGRETDAGDKVPPRCVRVMITDHPRDALRGEPLLLASPDAGGPRFMILTQTEGAGGMKLRSFPLPPTVALEAPPAADGKKPAVTMDIPTAIEVSFAGWSWFPAVTDGERLVLATDRGDFHVFGINQMGNTDTPLFSIPVPKAGDVPENSVRTQVVAAEEDTYWAVMGGELVRLRTAVTPGEGMKVITQGVPHPIGVPLHRSQIRSQLGLGVIVAQAGQSATTQAVGFDLRTGELRWRRKLGLIPTTIAAPGEGAVALAEDDGSVSLVEEKNGKVQVRMAALPLEESGKVFSVATMDGKKLWSGVVKEEETSRRLRVRRVEISGATKEFSVTLPERLFGDPIALDDSLLVPLGNGTIYRLNAEGAFVPGPIWRGETAEEDGRCLLAVAGPDEFLATDGGRRFYRWRWTANEKPKKLAGPWETKSKWILPPVTIPATEGAIYATAEESGGLRFWGATPTTEPLARRHAAEDNGLPAGPLTDRLVAVRAKSRSLVVASIDRRTLVAVDPESPGVAWKFPSDGKADAPEFIGWMIRGDRVYATDLVGKTFVLDLETGETVSVVAAPLPAAIAAAPYAPLSPKQGIIFLGDGTGQVVATESEKARKPETTPETPAKP